MSAQWRRLPPPALQLARVTAYLGFKPMEEGAAAAGLTAETSPEGMQAMFALLPSAPLQPVMSPEEYLRKKHGHE